MYYSRIRRDSACDTFQEPIITSVIDVKKITACGESGFAARFLEFDYVILQRVDGQDNIENPYLLCSHCNLVKGDRLQEHLVAGLRELRIAA